MSLLALPEPLPNLLQKTTHAEMRLLMDPRNFPDKTNMVHGVARQAMICSWKLDEQMIFAAKESQLV